MLTECRKYGLGFLAANQLIEQMSDEVRAAIYGATAIKIAGPVSYANASALSREMYCTPDFIRSMRAVERNHSEWAVTVEGLTDKKAIRLTLPYGALENAPRMDHEALLRMRAANRQAVLSYLQEPPCTDCPPPAAAMPPTFEIKPGKEW